MNRRQLERFQAGREQRLTAETERADDCVRALPCPLYSYDATWQSLFHKGWNSVSLVDIQAERLKQRAKHSLSVPSIARQSLFEIHQMLRRQS